MASKIQIKKNTDRIAKISGISRFRAAGSGEIWLKSWSQRTCPQNPRFIRLSVSYSVVKDDLAIFSYLGNDERIWFW